jgi:hypothetical protein
MTKYIKTSILLVLTVALMMACNQEVLEVKTNTALGGGTLTKYTAYTIASTTPSNVYGRVVFWKDSENKTLVQVSLYNTIKGQMHPVSLKGGTTDIPTEQILAFYDVSGDTGEFSTSKFYIIPDINFSSSLKDLSAHVTIYLSAADKTIVAAGNVGKNAVPVASN